MPLVPVKKPFCDGGRGHYAATLSNCFASCQCQLRIVGKRQIAITSAPNDISCGTAEQATVNSVCIFR
jgi:hypothetical protein